MRTRSLAFAILLGLSGHTVASPVVAAAESARWPSIMTLRSSSFDPSIETLPATRPSYTPSVLAIGDAQPAAVSDAPASTTVIRGGEIGGPVPPPEPEPREFVEPMLDPNDRGTPAKRNALKRQAERLAREEAALEQEQEQPGQPATP